MPFIPHPTPSMEADFDAEEPSWVEEVVEADDSETKDYQGDNTNPGGDGTEPDDDDEAQQLLNPPRPPTSLCPPLPRLTLSQPAEQQPRGLQRAAWSLELFFNGSLSLASISSASTRLPTKGPAPSQANQDAFLAGS
ncbi:unnamed protein product [Cyclocybe aegerita]|uniref:Uncharacterized protein n=1 Tax=Cyclocybe aegerita TaxID=1973307 RepID=A0A8S0XS64_CYCAE|nr:unnamed protein product [Cyclocybe aegerita]